MSFSPELKKSIKPQYTDNLAKDFYNALLSQANLYQRVSGYFTTSGVDSYVDGLEELAKNGGKVQFIISKEISKSDYEKIKSGYELKEELKTLRLAEKNSRLSPQTQEKLGNLAFMIANGKAEVKVAFVEQGIFHDKFGLITSGDEVVFFGGSANETNNGINRNYESITVDVSWDSSEYVQERIKDSQIRFERLWSNNEPGVTVKEASETTYEEIAHYQNLSNIPELPIVEDSKSEYVATNTIVFRLIDNKIVRIDNTSDKLTDSDRKLRIGSDLTTFFESDNSTIRNGVGYKDLQRIIEITEKRAARKKVSVIVSGAVREFILRNRYSIEQYKILGEVYKKDLQYFPDVKKVSFEHFSKVVQKEVTRPLLELQLQAAYFEYEMMRAANFSVPGAGKTAMILGVFAYLNRNDVDDNERIDRILVISPLNAFNSWKTEFVKVFESKKLLKSIDSQNKDFEQQLKLDWGVSNLILVNYESLPKYDTELKRLIDRHTLLVFDEVHRIKNPNGQRAKYALELSQIPSFKYVLTGTPIPNKYSDIYNFLHILYGSEYNSFFGWDVDELENPKVRKIEEINESIHPFYWRTNKKDLNVPPADEDILFKMSPSQEQLQLAEAIYFNEPSSFAKLIRLIQASTNPELVNYEIDYDELMSFDDDEMETERTSGISRRDFTDLLGSNKTTRRSNIYDDLNVSQMVSPKFTRGIKLIKELTLQGKKVLVWGIFVNTIKKIKDALEKEGISVNLVYGETPKEVRNELIDEFRLGNVQVLISNPQTLGESISLHQEVHDAVYFEYDFNLTYMLQSRDRIHRLGLQPNQYTRYYYLQTEGESSTSRRPGYIDEQIYKRIKEKEQLMYSAIDDDTISIEYSEDEIKDAIKIIDEERRRIQKYE